MKPILLLLTAILLLPGCGLVLLEEVTETVPVLDPAYAQVEIAANNAYYAVAESASRAVNQAILSGVPIDWSILVDILQIPGVIESAEKLGLSAIDVVKGTGSIEVSKAKFTRYAVRQYRCFFRVRVGTSSVDQNSMTVGGIIVPTATKPKE